MSAWELKEARVRLIGPLGANGVCACRGRVSALWPGAQSAPELKVMIDPGCLFNLPPLAEYWKHQGPTMAIAISCRAFFCFRPMPENRDVS